MTALVLALPLPSGCIVPSHVLGAMLGRVCAHLVQSIVGILFGDVAYAASLHSHFALIGATAFTAAVCRSFSVVIAVYELTSDPTTMLPTAVASLISIYISNQCSPSFFAAAARNKSLPFIPQPRTLVDGCEPVSSIMRRDVPMVPVECDSQQGRSRLQAALNWHPQERCFAVIAGDGSQQTLQSGEHVIGFARRELLTAALRSDMPTISRHDLSVATAVPPSMTVKTAFSALQLHQAQALLVVDAGRIEGIIDFSDVAKARMEHDPGGSARPC